VGLYTHRDLHHNLFGPIIQDEILLAEDTVTFIGQPIVIIGAESRQAIRAAKQAMVVDIERLEPVFTIDEAKRRRQFIGPVRTIKRGDADAALAGAKHVLQGTWINGGQDHFYLESQAALAVMGRAMTHAENAYYIPNVEIHGTVCRTNYPPNTAFRGFGGPQGVITIENIIEEIALYLKKDPLDVRMRNCYGIDDRNTTPYGQTVQNNTLPLLFREVRARADYDRRAGEVAQFNATSR